MGTKKDSQIIEALNGITIKMFENRRRRPDSREVFHTVEPTGASGGKEDFPADQEGEGGTDQNEEFD